MEITGLLERLQGLLPAIRARREDIENARRLPRDLLVFSETETNAERLYGSPNATRYVRDALLD